MYNSSIPLVFGTGTVSSTRRALAGDRRGTAIVTGSAIPTSIACAKFEMFRLRSSQRTDLGLLKKISNDGYRCLSYRCAKLWHSFLAELKYASSLYSLKKTISRGNSFFAYF